MTCFYSDQYWNKQRVATVNNHMFSNIFSNTIQDFPQEILTLTHLVLHQPHYKQRVNVTSTYFL